MARTKKKTRRSKSMTMPLAVVAGFAPLVVGTMNTAGGLEAKTWYMTQALTGYDTRQGQWWAPNLLKGAVPIMAGFAAHKVASKLGINRALAAARIPFVRI